MPHFLKLQEQLVQEGKEDLLNEYEYLVSLALKSESFQP